MERVKQYILILDNLVGLEISLAILQIFMFLFGSGYFLGSGYFAVDGNLPSETILP